MFNSKKKKKNVNVNVKLSLRAISLIKKGLWAISPG